MLTFTSLTDELQQWAVKKCFEELVTAIACGLCSFPDEAGQKKVLYWMSENGATTVSVQKHMVEDSALMLLLLLHAEQDAADAIYVGPTQTVIVLPE